MKLLDTLVTPTETDSFIISTDMNRKWLCSVHHIMYRWSGLVAGII